MTSRLSKAILTSHITFSVGWLGAIAVFLVLAITGLTSQEGAGSSRVEENMRLRKLQ